jgi:hypothetical protein
MLSNENFKFITGIRSPNLRGPVAELGSWETDMSLLAEGRKSGIGVTEEENRVKDEDIYGGDSREWDQRL